VHLTARAVLWQIYYPLLALCGVALLFLFPPSLDRSTATLIAVGVVALFLALVERPTKAAGTAAAPVVAIITASTVLFGWWALVLSAIAWTAVHLRMGSEGRTHWQRVRSLFAQLGQTTIAVYCMQWFLARVSQFSGHQSSQIVAIVTLFAVVTAGMIYQSINNVCWSAAYTLLGEKQPPLRFVNIGLIAAVYAYILVAVYHFGGLLGAALFYVFVGQDRMVRGVMGLTAQLQQLYHARAQARTLVGHLMRFTDVEQGRFATEVQSLSQRIAEALGLPKDEIATIGLAAELHEIGKARLPAKVRVSGNGNGSESSHVADTDHTNGHLDLTPTEAAQLRMYPRAGALMVRQADALLPQEIAYWIECHGEHFDGSGYPRGLKGEAIPLASRIIAVAREFVRLTMGANGNYETQKDAALASIRERSGTLYDPRLVQITEELLDPSRALQSASRHNPSYELHAESPATNG